MTQREDTKALTLRMIALDKQINKATDPKELDRLERTRSKMVQALHGRKQESV